MGKDPELEQRLLELAYGLLPDEEAAELRQRIDADAELARTYDEAERTAALFSEAAKLQLPKVKLARPGGPSPASAETDHPQPVLRTDGSVRARWARWADWTVAAAAGVLLLISLTGWLYHRAQRAGVAADHLRLQVTGPAKLQAGAANEYSVMTTSITGRPVSAQIEFALSWPGQERPMRHTEKADERGLLKVTVPADVRPADGAKLEVSARYEDKQEQVTARLPVEPVRYRTQLTLDRPLYRPGETVRYRSRTVSRFGWAAAPDGPIQFEILDAGGALVPGSRWTGVTRQGVGCGEFRIPDRLPGGKYTLVARGRPGALADREQTFFVRPYQAPRLRKALQFSRAGYGPGDRVVADFSAHRAEGGPAAGAALKIFGAVEGQVVHQETAETSPQGTFRVEFALPEKIERADAQLVVVADDGGTRETLARTIPVNLGRLDVTFRPEGGSLVANLENRVYFAARNPLGQPVDIRGTIVDGRGNRLARVEATRAGMGAFSIVPFPGEEYYLEVEGPGSQGRVTLPEVVSNRKVVLNAGIGVFQAGEPLEFNVRAAEARLPLVASAWCRGVLVGQQALVTSRGANPVAIPLQDEADGVIRLTIYDYGADPPTPVAERLLYRRPARRLHVDVVEEGKRYAPGDAVALWLSVEDEGGRPVTATSTVAVVDDALWSLAGDDAPDTPAQLRFGSELGALDDLDGGDFYLAEGREAAVALDLLLGNRPCRAPAEETPTELDGKGHGEEPLLRVAAPDAPPYPPAMFDNLLELQQEYQESLAAYQAKQRSTSSALTTLSFFGGVGLVMLVAMLNLLNIAGGARLWAPAILAATVCLIVGGILVDPLRRQSRPQGAVAFVPFHLAPSPPESAKKLAETRGGHELGVGIEEAEERRHEERAQTRAAAELELGLEEAADGRDKALKRRAERPGGAAAGRLQPPLDALDTARAEPAAAVPEEPAPAKREDTPGADRHYRSTHDVAPEAGTWGRDTRGVGKRDRLSGRPDDYDPSRQRGRVPGSFATEDGRELRLEAGEHRYRRFNELGLRTDFDEVLFWDPSMPVHAKDKPPDGDAAANQIQFDLPDSLTTFRVLVEAQTPDGRVGWGRTQIVSQIPFSLEPKLPPEAAPGDRIDLPLAVVNRTSRELPARVVLEHTERVRLEGKPERNLPLEADSRRREYFALDVVGPKGDAPLTFRGTAGELKDEVTGSLKVVAPDDSRALSVEKAGGAGPVQLSTQLARQKVPWGETVALSVELANTDAAAQSRIVAVLGLPAGLEVRPDQLEELQAARKVDNLQTRPRQLICSWRSLEPNEKIALKLDLIAAIPGKYTGPASCVYLEQDADRRGWNEPLVVEITTD